MTEEEARERYGRWAEQCGMCLEWGHAGQDFDGTEYMCEPPEVVAAVLEAQAEIDRGDFVWLDEDE